jgi:hypothetical protein
VCRSVSTGASEMHREYLTVERESALPAAKGVEWGMVRWRELEPHFSAIKKRKRCRCEIAELHANATAVPIRRPHAPALGVGCPAALDDWAVPESPFALCIL